MNIVEANFPSYIYIYNGVSVEDKDNNLVNLKRKMGMVGRV